MLRRVVITDLGAVTPVGNTVDETWSNLVAGKSGISTQSMTGHLFGASGDLKALVCVKVITDGIIPPTINYETPDPACNLDYCPNEARPTEVSVALSNSFGLGGHNATIIVKKYTDD